LIVFSSKEERKKKESGDSSVSGQPAVAGGFIYADFRSELRTYLAPQALFT
jgi:hypothetical protein